jgi:hypothetical protein
VRAAGTVWSGSGFTVARLGLTGSYRITVPPTPTGRFLVPVVTPSANLTPSTSIVIAKIVGYSKSAIDLTHTIDIEMHDLTGVLVDSDFSFIVTDRS